ncbi:uncharacterized protein [Dendrobates tinctorius]|uniref:uncharacterized protein n=1 Tax=Dendrobates tinctorius TaxID=92724 RepID=UPI003CCA21CA
MGLSLNSEEEKAALEILESLAEESNPMEAVSSFPVSLFNKSKKFPNLNTCSAVETFVRLVTHDIEELKKNYRFNPTFMSDKKAIMEMQGWKDVIFKRADKGGNLVLWPRDLYEKQAHKLLSDTNCYKKLTFSPLPAYHKELNDILLEAHEKGIIPKSLLEFVESLKPKLPTLYLIPKIHKNIEDPPGRPIVSGKEGLSELICQIVDYYLKPLVTTLPSHILDTTAALRRLDQLHLGDDMILVTADVEALYTSIRHDQGLRATSWFLRNSNLDPLLAALIIILLEFILTHNCFLFKEQVFLQTQGTAMGAACAPAYANLFLGFWEREIFQCSPVTNIEKAHNWMRYIDDVMFVWEGPLDELKTFMSALNDNDLNIKLTYSYGKRWGSFCEQRGFALRKRHTKIKLQIYIPDLEKEDMVIGKFVELIIEYKKSLGINYYTREIPNLGIIINFHSIRFTSFSLLLVVDLVYYTENEAYLTHKEEDFGIFVLID